MSSNNNLLYPFDFLKSGDLVIYNRIHTFHDINVWEWFESRQIWLWDYPPGKDFQFLVLRMAEPDDKLFDKHKNPNFYALYKNKIVRISTSSGVSGKLKNCFEVLK